jgi:hypothetical protein
MSSLEEPLLLTARAAVLTEKLERALLGLVALARQILQRLLARLHLLAADNAVVLVLHQILLLQTTSRVLRRAMEYLRLGTNCHLELLRHPYTFDRDFYLAGRGHSGKS